MRTRIQTEAAIAFVKSTFEQKLIQALDLQKVSAPMIVVRGTGVNDDLNGVERPVGFPIRDMQEQKAEVVHSLAKWKRMRLKDYEIEADTGILTDMRALRPDEELTALHSIYVDQWDWEKHLKTEDRTLDKLKMEVKKIYQALYLTEQQVAAKYTEIEAILPPKITFLHTEDLQEMYPDLSPKQREDTVAKKYGAVFIIGIGGDLPSGEPHDGRAPDYDDWSTPTSKIHKGLNGDIVVWNPVLGRAFELSSMGIRVDKKALEHQLEIRSAEDRKQLYFHRRLFDGDLTESIGGGIGQSRMCMFLLRKRHIGEVQVSIWSDEIYETCSAAGIALL